MLPLIYTHWAYTLLFAIAFVSNSTLELLGPARWRHGEVRDRGSTIVLNTAALCGILLCFLLPLLLPGSTIAQPSLFFTGVALLLTGMALRWYAIRTLGQFFTGKVSIHQDQQIVQQGPYKLVRHPAYTGIILAGVGTGLMLTNWASVIAIVTGLLIGLLYRMSVEEQALLLACGQSYREYMQQTKRLIPFLY